MKNNYLYLFLLLLLSNFCRGQNCTLQKVVSDPTICIGNNAMTTLSSIEKGGSYHLRKEITNIGTPKIGNAGSLNFIVPLHTASNNKLSNYTSSLPSGITDVNTVTVGPSPKLTLTSANATQTVCQNSAISTITYSVTNATGVSVSGLPTGVTGSYSAGVFTISGTPTVASPPAFSFTVTATNADGTDIATGTLTVTLLPTAMINYAGTPFCTSLTTAQSATLTGTGAYTGGTYSASPAGLSINTSTGAITPSSSTAGTYIVTYTIPASGGCAAIPVTKSVTITAVPTATISYIGTPFCTSAVGTKAITLTGTGAYTGGTYTASSTGLTIDPSTGAITPSSSTPGTYTVTYTTPAGGGCVAVAVTTSVTITAIPTANISYAGTPFCTSLATAQSVTLTGTGAYTGGNYTAVPAGLTINASTGAITPSSSTPGTYTITYTTPASGGCAAVAVTTSVTITAAPTATISYAGAPFCISLATAQSVTLTGTGAYTGGTFSAPAGLSINSSTGDITPNSSTPGTYTVTYTIPSSNGCAAIPITTNVTITNIPTASISYAGTPFCTSLAAAQSVTLTGTGAYTGGNYSASPAGLTINATTGAITPSSSTPGTYTITYTTPASGGCATVAVTTSVTITAAPTATISYAGAPFCISLATTQSVTLSGTAAYTGGTFSAPAGLSINPSTGDITPSSSSAGTYTVTYTIPASNGCAAIPVTTSVTITNIPTASISYAGTPFCTSLAAAQSVTLTGTGAYTGGTYTAVPAGLTINASTGAITPSSSTAGTYTITYTTPASGGCAAVAVTTSVTITAAPTATISYAGSPFCTSLATTQSVILNGTAAYTGGTFSAPAGLSINTSNGDITPSSSSAGTYTVTYTIPASDGCAAIPVTTSVTITNIPTASISYAGTPFCTSLAAAQSVTLTGTGAYTGGIYTAVPAGLTINASTGAITPSSSTAGTYTITYTTPASGGCTAVSATASVTVTTVPTATISYTGAPFCKSLATAQSVTLNGTEAYAGGTFSASGGLSINASTGDITPSSSSAGTYTVTYTIPASNGCAAIPVTTSVTITNIPTASISYAGTPFCTSLAAAQSVTLTGTGAYTGGNYSASPAGLTINASTGAITPSSSTAGTYTITYTTPASGGCTAVSATASVTITTVPTATISYAGTPFCKSLTATQSVTLTGTAGYIGGTFSAPAGLSINTSTGDITPSSSTAGTYTVTYTIPASGGCALVSATTSVTITNIPTASISYAGTPFCTSLTAAQSVTLTGTGAYTGGTYTAVPAGLTINASTGAITPSSSTAGTYTITYTTPASGGCAAVGVTTSITITTVPTASISYAGTPFCKSLTTAQNVTLTGTAAYTGGTFSAPAGLSINTSTGDITPSSSTAGTYTVTYTIPASGGCALVSATTSVTITNVPTATISYAGTPFCKSLAAAQSATLTGTGAYTGGTYTAVPAGLTINASTGAITPSSSTAETYTITYTTPTSGGCTAVSATASVTITTVPTATISYAGTPFCKSLGTVQSVTLTGTAAYTGGTFSAPAGLSINTSTGDITPSSSTAGTYTVTYTIPASGGCAVIPVTTSVTITAAPTATISYAGTPFCKSLTAAQSVTRSGTGAFTGGTYSASPAGLTIDPSTGAIIPSTSTAGTYTITYTTPASGGCAAVAVTTSVTITTVPTATISYAGTPFCKSLATPQSVTLTGTAAYTGGTFTASAGLSINTSTGDITPSSSTAGTYTVTYTIPASGGCALVSATTSVTITNAPTAAISYAGSQFCPSVAVGQNVTLTGTGVYAGGTYSASPAGLSINSSTGTIIPSTSAIGTYTVTYSTPASGGCSSVNATTTVIMDINPVGGSVSASNSSMINTTTECFTASGTLYLSGYVGSIAKWQYSNTAATSWTDIANTSANHTYTNITQNTIFRAVIQNSSGCSTYSSNCMINVIPNLKPSPVIATPTTICVGDSSVLSSSSSYATSSQLATGGAFSNANPPGWQIDNCNNCLSSGGSNDVPGPWQLSSTNGKNYSGVDYTSNGKFAIAHGEGITSYMYTPVFNTFGLPNATLTFKHAYKFLAGARGEVQISINGGSTYTTIQTYTGTLTPSDPFTAAANSVSIDLNAYLGQGNLKIRFYFYGIDTVSGNANGSSWAIDDIAIPDAPTNLSTQWVDAVTGQIVSNTMTWTVSPTQTTTYAVTSYLNGCNSFGTDGTEYITIVVNPRPTSVIGSNQTVCLGGTATFSVALTGTAPWRLTYSNGTTSTTVNNIMSSPYVFNIPNMMANATYTITALNDSKCTSNASDRTGSAVVTVLNGTAGLWTGLVSTDWFDCKNWAGGLPSATIDAVIPTVTTAGRMPVIDNASPFAAAYSFIASARDVIINTSASITMNANSNLQVKRDWKNRGSFIPGTGTVTFNGATANQVQLINSGIKLNEAFYNLTLNCTNGAKGINVPDAFELTVANNLVLTSGDLRLTGEAQLVQNGTSANPSGGTGVLLRDQQGTKSSYHYNYWSSPVSADNLSYTIGGVLKDGTNAAANPFNQAPINFGWGYDFADGPLTSPIKISNRWLYKYTQVSTSYWSWQLIESTGSIKVGEGYTMKGVTGLEPVTNYQNYVFAGKPNNGNINLTIVPNQLYLIGNPYPSAMDADEFIKDNILTNGRAVSNVFNGALYFWDHFGAQTHVLGQYIGGYATYSLMGGVVAVASDPMINNNMSSSSKIPKRYIPVAQGFFVRTDLGGEGGVTGLIAGGTIRFKNSQRAFKIESLSNSIFLRNENQTVDSDIDNREKIRLSFESPSGLRRQLLVGADPQATDDFDMGYDAPMIDVNQDDMYWVFSDGKFVIQAVNDFNVDQVIPLAFKISTAGTTKIKIDDLENIPASTEIYLFDSVTGLYHDIKNEDFVADFPTGEYQDRFTLRFTTETLGTDDVTFNNGIMVFADANDILNIKNNILDTKVESVHLYNILGQSIAKWNVADEEQSNIKIPVENIRSGTYIVKLKTSDGSLSKKVVIR